jgi:CDGSH-type Zn-finger protein/uncharacterized Fe-S cluster protein YjdI
MRENAVMEPAIRIESREQLLYLLAEAAEIEHNLMCCYLFAAFSLKSNTEEDVSETELSAIRRWRQAVIAVAIEEMAHLSLVANITTALGGAAHFSRPNFPVGTGLYPSGVVVKLAPFDRATLQHFIYLERPEGFDVPDGEGFSAARQYVRETVTGKCMPSAQDYLTVGHLYRALAEGLRGMVQRYGEESTFIGDPSAQIGPDIASLPGLTAVHDLQTALKAVDTIVEQGEGARSASSDSHYGRFLAIANEYDALVARRSNFVPHRPVGSNPVMRRPPEPTGKLFVDASDAAKLLDFGNAQYGLMLRCLAQAFGRPGAAEPKRIFIDAAIELMYSLVPIAEHLTRTAASPLHPGLTAGLSFAMLRDIARLPDGRSEWSMLSERIGEIAHAAESLSSSAPLIDAADRLKALRAKFERQARRLQAHEANATQPVVSGTEVHERPHGASDGRVENGIEIASGHLLTIKFEAKRCIHSRFCVLGQPSVYKANVQGPWIDPDAATIEDNIGVAHSCPSGAITYDRKDGGPEESAPNVNLLTLRENGPYALRAPLMIDGEFAGFRATLCRCGASKNKPFCDASHYEIGFSATGEPAMGTFEALGMCDGEVEITLYHNGRLALAGNLEIFSGTSRTIVKTMSRGLCRCGHSANMPYCNGTLARIGFTT